MRALPLLLAFLMVAGSLPLLHAQAAPPAVPVVPVLDDPAGDQKATAGDTVVGSPGGRYAASDLIGLAMEEGRDDITLHLSVGSLSTNPEVPFLESTIYMADFATGGMVYRIQFTRQVAGPGAPQYSARLYVYDAGRGAFDPIERIVVSADSASNTLLATVPRNILLDANGAAPFPGRSLSGFHVRSASIFSQGNGISLGPAGGTQSLPRIDVSDSMPDSGNGSIDLPIRLGLQQSGNARLHADIPMRASNGEATTMVFQVNATNLGPKQRFHLSHTGEPATWQVDLPSDLLEVPANSTLTFPVLASMPFAHAHGTVNTFTVEMSGMDHPDDVGRIQLGVRFTQPPQPAGHHDTLYLHTNVPEGDQTTTNAFAQAFGFDPANLYFNTLGPDEDENDGKVPVGGQDFGFTQSLPPQQLYAWHVPLSPGLQMGLDFDLARTGDFKASVDNVLPMEGARMSGRMVYTIPDPNSRCQRFGSQQGQGCSRDDQVYGPGTHITVATLGPSASQDVAPNSKATLFDLPVMGTHDGDYVLFHPDATLVIELNLTFLRADSFIGPKDMPKIEGGEMTLPLLEYHDPVTQIFTSISSLMITVDGEQQRVINPGKTALYHLGLMNHGKDTVTYNLDLTGPGQSWALMLGPHQITVPAGKTLPLGIAVTAPKTARDGERSDLVLSASNSKNTSERTLARLLTTVDTKAVHPDDTALVPELAAKLAPKKSPGLEPIVPLAVVALAALLVRRRRW
jgi:hypothetical protein